MSEYLSPGVYVEEVSAGPKPIEGVSTSIAGAVGVTARGPDTGKPVLITSFADYQRTFGGPVVVDAVTEAKWSDDPELGTFWTFPYAIKGFFDNGGKNVYVRRVVSTGAVAAWTQLGQGVIATITADATASSLTLRLSSLIGISKNDVLPLWIDGVAAGTVTVASYNTAAGTITLAAPLVKRVSAGDFVVVRAAAAGHLKLRAKSAGVWGNDLSARVYPSVSGSYGLMADQTIANNAAATTSIAADVNAPSQAFTVAAGAGAGFFVADHIQVGGVAFVVGAVAGDTITVAQPAQTWSAGTSVIRVRYAAKPGPGTTLQVWGASSLYKNALVEIENLATSARRYDLVAVDVVGNTVTLTNPIAETLWEGQRVTLIEGHAQITYQPDDGPQLTEDITNIHMMEAFTGDPMHVVALIDARSQFVDVITPPAIAIGTLDAYPLAIDVNTHPIQWMPLTHGDDSYGTLDASAFVGQDLGPNLRTGIQSLEDIDDISICVVPGLWSSLVQNALILHCETLKYRFAILDPRPVNPASVDPIGDIQAFRAGFDSEYAALYFPGIEVPDPFGDDTVVMGASGHMAGLYARVDDARGVYKAPANEVIAGIDTSNGFHGLEVEITKREQDVLNPIGINALRFFPDRGTRVWGARTLSSDSDWRYINVRRLFIYVERSIDVGTQWLVFEPNDEKTWARVRQSLVNFLTTVWRSGALFGSKADDAFFVRCDLTTMTQDDIDNGRLIVVVGIAPVKPAEFVIFRIQQKTLDQTTT